MSVRARNVWKHVVFAGFLGCMVTACFIPGPDGFGKAATGLFLVLIFFLL